ncbi:MAG: radical SAM protein [Eubacteriales bacterium]|nr:radical SAM protein [Eubacteriales bacterium]
MAHFGEEPFISGQSGSGTLFFSGCALGCRFCQNYPISQATEGVFRGRIYSESEIINSIEALISQGVHNINWVTASHYSLDVIKVIDQLRMRGHRLPMIWNTSAYERVETMRQLDGKIQIYLPDFKFFDDSLSAGLTSVRNYPAIAQRAILEMHRQQPLNVFDRDGHMISGFVLRHLILPGHYRDSLRIIDWIVEHLPADIAISLMSQFTPFAENLSRLSDFPELSRKLTTYEYQKVVDYALQRGLTQVMTQQRTAATATMTPDFT